VNKQIGVLLRRYFITGLLIWVPLGITLWVLNLIVGTMDQTLLLVPAKWRTESFLGIHIPGLGVILTLAVVLITGLLAANFIGQHLVNFWEHILGRIPIVRSIYSSVKQVSDTLLSGSGQSFRKALLVQYPREGCWTVAFQTGMAAREIHDLVGEELVAVFIPTTPNPTSGFFLMMKQSDTRELGMSVDQALKYIVSMGVVIPGAVKPDAVPQISGK
jgi:uncharacterized membrane protein